MSMLRLHTQVSLESKKDAVAKKGSKLKRLRDYGDGASSCV
jgi:hypothetical protein